VSEQLEEKVEVYEKQLHCDGHAGADGPHHDAKEETGRGGPNWSKVRAVGGRGWNGT